MDKKEIMERFAPKVEEQGCFVVAVDVTPDDDVTITVEKEEGCMELSDCEALDEAFHAMWPQDEEDYSLTVTSAGLDQPFIVLRQYRKAMGTEVEAGLKGGRKLTGVLMDADEDSVTLKYESMDAVEGKKKKVRTEHVERFPLEGVNYVRPHITF